MQAPFRPRGPVLALDRRPPPARADRPVPDAAQLLDHELRIVLAQPDRTHRDAVTLFYLGVHNAAFLERTAVPLFISRSRLEPYTRLPRPTCSWALDSGGFTELFKHRGWKTSAAAYIAFVRRILDGMKAPEWVAPQDWMCEPFMLNGRTVREHQARTVDNFATLRAALGSLVVPAIQGYSLRDYERCIDLYTAAGVTLADERLVGLGSVCRRSGTVEATRMIRALVQDHRVRLHGFGIKGATFLACRDVLASADSMAWSYAARKQGRNGNALSEALSWRERLLGRPVAT